MILETRGYNIDFSGSQVEEVSDSDFEFYYDNHGEFESLYITFPSNASCKLMEARVVKDSLVLYHLDVPEDFRGEGLGRIGLAFFYVVLKQKEFSKYAIKFGGGKRSAGFLTAVGFDKKYIHTSDNSDFAGFSVMVGEFTSTGSRDTDWRLDPINPDTYPTNFFRLKS